MDATKFLLFIFFVILVFGCVTVERNPTFQDRPTAIERDRGSNR